MNEVDEGNHWRRIQILFHIDQKKLDLLLFFSILWRACMSSKILTRHCMRWTEPESNMQNDTLLITCILLPLRQQHFFFAEEELESLESDRSECVAAYNYSRRSDRTGLEWSLSVCLWFTEHIHPYYLHSQIFVIVNQLWLFILFKELKLILIFKIK
jgi:hypothetical protein